MLLSPASTSRCLLPSPRLLSRPFPSLPPPVPALRYKSTLSVLEPSSTADRQVPTPLLFLSAPKWASSPPCRDLYPTYLSHLSQHGFRCLLLDLDPDVDLSTLGHSSTLLSLLRSHMVSTLRSHPEGTPFPPVLVAKGLAAIVAQAYVSSHPLTALQLVDPPLSNRHLTKQYPHLLPTELDEFRFHTKFPCRVVWSQEEMERQRRNGTPWYDVHRIEHEREQEADESLDRFVFNNQRDEVEDTRRWLEDEVGLVEDVEPLDDDLVEEIAEDVAEAVDSSSSSSPSTSRLSPSPSAPPTWYTTGTYTLQPHSRKYPLTLDERHLSESFIRGSGPGGQAINKLSTNVELIHLPTNTRLTCQETRSRQQNREIARRRMSRILERIVRASVGGQSRTEKEVDKHRKRKRNKKKKQARRRREKEEEGNADGDRMDGDGDEGVAR
ncbi:hypothetical protein ACQY0O_004682 [Thecaphora frezii]